ncbi:TolC family protein [Bacteroides coprosuis]|uniref:TolC family protein n=1 Tax=Bacteroides coprosuis TaxID=151276 RepID=UPI001DA39D84|nr:TolC family protein [Bacteroides coprosuis]HJD92483.1 TolC family protein [Bacteroides coprosuis]
MKNNIILVLLCLCPTIVIGQVPNDELDELIEKAIQHNKSIRSSEANVASYKANVHTAWDLGKTNVYYSYDANNLAANDRALRVWGIEQEFQFPSLYATQRGLNKSKWMEQNALHQIVLNDVSLSISKIYDRIVFLQNKEVLFQRLDSLYASFAQAGTRKFELGEANYLEKLTTESKTKQIALQLKQVQAEKRSTYEQLAAMVQIDEPLIIQCKDLQVFQFRDEVGGKYWKEEYLNRVSHSLKKELSLQSQSWIPSFTIELFTGTNPSLDKRMNGFQIGIGIPLVFNSNIAKRKKAKFAQQSWNYERESKQIKMDKYILQKRSDISQLQENISYYENQGKRLSSEIIKTAEGSYKGGEIDYFQFIQSIENATDIEVQYLESVLAYNKACLELYYFDYNE